MTVPRELTRFAFWLPARLVNTLNAREHWIATAARARKQRDGVAAAVLAELGRAYRFAVPPTRPKAIRFEAHVGPAFDDDNLRAALKSVRDGLMDAGVIHGDAPIHGHTFAYEQLPGTARPNRGVRVVVELRKDGPDGG